MSMTTRNGSDRRTVIARSAHAATAADAGVPAAHSVELSATDLPDWVQLLPAGTFVGRDGRGPYHNPDPVAVINLTRELFGADLPIDYGHALEQPGPIGDAAPAAGWITELEVRSGEIWGRVDWTDEGARRIRSREYRYLSPVFLHPEKGDKVITALLRAGLTNRPNLSIKSINAQEPHMKTFQQRVAVALGLDEAAAEDAIVAQCTAAAAAVTGFTRVAQALQLDAAATADQAVQAVQAAQVVDPTKYVPREQYDTLATSLQSERSEKAAGVVDAAIAAGKITPAQRAWATAYHSKDPDGFAAFVSAAPKIVGETQRTTTTQDPAAPQLDDTQKSVCAMLAIDPVQFIKNHPVEA